MTEKVKNKVPQPQQPGRPQPAVPQIVEIEDLQPKQEIKGGKARRLFGQPELRPGGKKD